MDVSRIRFELRKRRLDEIFEFGLVILKNHIALFLKLTAPYLFLFFALNGFLIYFLEVTVGGEGAEAGTFFVITALLVFEICFIDLLLVVLNSRLLFSKELKVSTVYSDRKGWIHFFFKGVILRGSLLTFLSPFLVTLWFGLFRYFFVAETIVLEQLSGKALGKRLSTLTSRANIFSFWILTFVVFFIYYIVAYNLASEVVSLTGIKAEPWLISFSPASILMQPVILAYVIYHSTVKFLFYIDTRSHIEGWDLELQLRRGLNQSLDRA